MLVGYIVYMNINMNVVYMKNFVVYGICGMLVWKYLILFSLIECGFVDFNLLVVCEVFLLDVSVELCVMDSLMLFGIVVIIDFSW